MIGNNMNKILILGFSILSATILLSCRPKAEENQRDNGANEIEQNARQYLQPMLHVGDATTNLIKQFGAPLDQFETKSHELSMSFYFSDDNQTAVKSGVGGFTAFFISNRLVHWDPIYTSVNPKFENSSQRQIPVAFAADHAVLMFSVVSQNQKAGWVYINSTKFPNLGYINQSSDITIYSGNYVVYNSSQKSRGAIELLLSHEDADKLYTLTSTNVGNRIAVIVGTQIVFAPYVQAPIPDGQVMLELPEPSYSILLQALKTAHK